MALELTMLYRGPLSSCNYDCHYCPFAKHRESQEELEHDRRQLERFTNWVIGREGDRLSVFFTPWGEAMTRAWYRDTMTRFSHLPQVRRVAVQTNLAWNTRWLDECNLDRVGLWCTWHPDQVSRERFVAKCRELDAKGVRYSVGMVGLKENFQRAIQLRKDLAESVYLWINAYKDVDNYYTDTDITGWSQIDRHFQTNLRTYATLGMDCRTGDSVVSVDGDGTLRRCHFVKTPIGNLYDEHFAAALQPRQCSKPSCGCHIGYVHLPDLRLDEVYGDSILERVPTDFSFASGSLR